MSFAEVYNEKQQRALSRYKKQFERQEREPGKEGVNVGLIAVAVVVGVVVLLLLVLMYYSTSYTEFILMLLVLLSSLFLKRKKVEEK